MYEKEVTRMRDETGRGDEAQRKSGIGKETIKLNRCSWEEKTS